MQNGYLIRNDIIFWVETQKPLGIGNKDHNCKIVIQQHKSPHTSSSSRRKVDLVVRARRSGRSVKTSERTSKIKRNCRKERNTKICYLRCRQRGRLTVDPVVGGVVDLAGRRKERLVLRTIGEGRG